MWSFEPRQLHKGLRAPPPPRPAASLLLLSDPVREGALSTWDGRSHLAVSTPEPPGRGEGPPSREPWPRPFPNQRPRPQSRPSEQQVSPFCFQTPGASRCLARSPKLRVEAAAWRGGLAHLRGACEAGVSAFPGTAGGGVGVGDAGTQGGRCPQEPAEWQRSTLGLAVLRGGEESGSRFQVPPLPPAVSRGAQQRGGGAERARGRGARTMARVPARLQFRVQLRFVTEEQLFGAGPLSLPTPKSLQLDVHPAGEEADATVTDGEVPSPAGKLGPGVCEHNVRARGGGGGRGCVCRCVRSVRVLWGAWKCGLLRLCRPQQVCTPRLARGKCRATSPVPSWPKLRLYCAHELGCRGQPGPENLSWR